MVPADHDAGQALAPKRRGDQPGQRGPDQVGADHDPWRMEDRVLTPYDMIAVPAQLGQRHLSPRALPGVGAAAQLPVLLARTGVFFQLVQQRQPAL